MWYARPPAPHPQPKSMSSKSRILSTVELLLWRWVRSVESRPRAALAATAAACLGAMGAAFALLGVDTDTSGMIDPSLPFQERALEIREAFPQLKNDIVVVVEATTPDETAAAARRLEAMLGEDANDIERVFSASASEFFRRAALLYLNEQELASTLADLGRAAPLLERLAGSPDAPTLLTAIADSRDLAGDDRSVETGLFAAIDSVALVAEARLAGSTEPLSWRSLFDDDDASPSRVLVSVTPVLDFTRLQPAKPAIGTVREATAALEDEFNGRVRTHLTGDQVLRFEELESVRNGMGLSLLISLVTVAGLLYLGLRSARLSVYVMISLVASLALTTGFAAVSVGELNLVSVAFAVLLIGLGLDFAIHILLHAEEEIAGGLSPRRALLRSVREIGGALALAAPTTALAFFSFIPTRFVGMAQLGLIAGVGVLIAFIVSVTVPIALIVLSPPRRTPRSSGSVRTAASAFTRFAARPAALLVAAAGVAAFALVPQARFDADPMALRNPNAPSVQGFSLLFDTDGAAPYRLSVLAPSSQDAAAIAERVTRLATVADARSARSFVPQDQNLKRDLIEFEGEPALAALTRSATPATDPADLGEIADRFRSLGRPQDLRLAAALSRLSDAGDDALAGFEADLFRYWPQFKADLTVALRPDTVRLEDVPPAVRERFISSSGRHRVEITPTEDLRDPDALRRFVETVSVIEPEAAGGAAQTLEAGRVIARSVSQATLTAAAVVVLFLWIAVGRVGPVLVMIAPLALAGSLTIAGSVLFDMPFNYANVIVLPLLIGIGVDSGIHLVLRDRGASGSDARSVFETSTPRAVLFSALTTAASFASLSLSPHRGTASMGMLLTIAIAATLATMLVLLPFLLDLTSGRLRTASAKSPKSGAKTSSDETEGT